VSIDEDISESGHDWSRSAETYCVVALGCLLSTASILLLNEFSEPWFVLAAVTCGLGLAVNFVALRRASNGRFVAFAGVGFSAVIAVVQLIGALLLYLR
jgi:uncharacterized membrane protein YccC